jgi:ComF family protein
MQKKPPFDMTMAPLAYAGSVRYLLTQFKFHARLSHAVPLVHVLREAVVGRDAALDTPQALIPVPIHRKRLAERGFNQSVELARPLARDLQIPLLLDAVQRQRATVPQFQLSGDERVVNVRGAFVLRAGTVLPKHVAIVDDVLTTGATVRELAKLLRKHGCERVEVWCAARAG